MIVNIEQFLEDAVEERCINIEMSSRDKLAYKYGLLLQEYIEAAKNITTK